MNSAFPVIFGASELIVECKNSRSASAIYSVTLVNGAWPSDSELITLCDNHPNISDTTVRHFGGRVKKFGQGKAEVIVYID